MPEWLIVEIKEYLLMNETSSSIVMGNVKYYIYIYLYVYIYMKYQNYNQTINIQHNKIINSRKSTYKIQH